MREPREISIDSALADYADEVEDGWAILAIVLEDRKLEIARAMKEIVERRARDARLLETQEEEGQRDGTEEEEGSA